MFEEYKTYRYILPGYLLVVYTAMIVFPFLSKDFVVGYWKEILTLVIGGGLGIGLLLGYILYQVYTDFEWRKSKKERDKFMSSIILRKGYKDEFQRTKDYFEGNFPETIEKDDFLFERDLIRHFMYSRDTPSLGNLQPLWSYYASRTLNGMYVPISTIVTSVTSLVILLVLQSYYSGMQIVIDDFSLWRLSLLFAVVVAIVIISFFFRSGVKRVRQEVESLEVFLMIANKKEMNEFTKNIDEGGLAGVSK